MDKEQTGVRNWIPETLEGYRFRIHSGGGEDSLGLGPEDFCVEVLNDDPEKSIWIDWEQAGEEYTLSFCGMHDHFGCGESLDEMLTLLRDILENRWCSKSVGRKDDQGRFRPDWYSFLPAEEAEKEIDQTVSALSLSPPGDTEARYFFWDGSKDRTVPQPGQEQLNKKNRETLCGRIRKLIGRTGKDKTEVRQ